jgi:hypothetical protein
MRIKNRLDTYLRLSVMCRDAQMPRAQDAQERLFICG